jgi:hypothetical protein
MATQATSTSNSLSLAPEQVNGSGTQTVQVQQPQAQGPTGIAGNGQSTLASAAVGYVAAQQMTRVDPLTGAIDGTLRAFQQTPQAVQAQLAPDQTSAVFSGNQPAMSVEELMIVLMALASERTMPWFPAEQQIKSYGYQPSVAQMVLLMRTRDQQALNARVMEGSSGATKPEEKNAEGKK